MSNITARLCTLGFAAITLHFVEAGSCRAAVVGLWRFNEASGDAADSSGNGNTGTLVGPTATRVAGKPGFGNAAEFLKVVDPDELASSSYMEVPADYSLQVGLNPGDPWTFAAWTFEYSDGFGFLDSNYGTIFHYRRTISDTVPYPAPDYGLTVQSGAPGDTQYYLWSGRPDDSTNPWRIGTGVDAEANVDTWTHIAMVYTGTDVVFYTNGTEQFRTTVGAQDVLYPGYTGALQIGAAPGFLANRNYNGRLDDVAVFNQALTPTELATIMAGDFSAFIDPLPEPTVAEWQPTTFGTWEKKGNWFPSVSPNSTSITAVFGGNTALPTTVVTDQAVTVKGLQFDHAQSYVLAGSGSITLNSGGAGNSTVSVLNAGEDVTHEVQVPVQLSSNTDISLAAGTVLELDNRLELNGRTLNLSGDGRLNVNNDAASGTTGTLNNSGTLGGSGKITGSLVNTAAGTLVVDILGSGPLGAQGLNVTGNAALDGTLLIDLAPGFTPTGGSMFTVLTAGSITDNGLILAGDSAGFSYSISGGTSLVLTFAGAVLNGDYNGDGIVDAADYVVWRRNDGSLAGYNQWRNNFGQTSASRAADSTSVPEPTSSIVLLTAFAILGGWRHARVQFIGRSLLRLVCAAYPARALSAVAFLMFVLSQSAFATVLTFDGEYGGSGPSPGTYEPIGNGFSVIDEYGDRVVGLIQSDIVSDDFGATDWYNLIYDESGEGFTPNVVVDYPISSTGVGSPAAFRIWSPYASFDKAAYPSDGSIAAGDFYMTFTADPGVSVRIDSLQLDRSLSAMPESVTVRVHQGNDSANLGAQLYSSGPISVTPGTPHAFTPNVSANALTLVYSFAGNGANPLWDWAIDNVKFSQIGGGIATTATWGVAGSGLWSRPSNWTPDTAPNLTPNGNDRTAVLGNATTGPSTVVLNQDITIKEIEFNHTFPYSVAGTGSLTLEADSGNALLEVVNAGGTVAHQITTEITLHSHTTASLAGGTTLEINNQLNLGDFNLTKTGGGTLRINNLVTSTGGVASALSGMIAGSGTIAGDFLNDGATIAPGNSPGVLSVGGNYYQSSGTLQIELAGDQQGAQYDLLAVGGDVVLDGGVLEVILLNGFSPQVGDVFDIMDFGSLTGQFDDLVLPEGWAWDTSRLGVDGSLTVIGIVPEPSALVLMPMAAFTMLAIRRKSACRAVQFSDKLARI